MKKAKLTKEALSILADIQVKYNAYKACEDDTLHESYAKAEDLRDSVCEALRFTVSGNNLSTKHKQTPIIVVYHAHWNEPRFSLLVGKRYTPLSSFIVKGKSLQYVAICSSGLSKQVVNHIHNRLTKSINTNLPKLTLPEE